MVVHFVSRWDVFISLPTEYGKTLCFSVLPWTLTTERRKKKVHHCCSLNNERFDGSQVKACREKGMTAGFVNS